ncbi:MAG: glycosyltransferase family 2 protein [Candidatus Gastranaerophilales bacterium]|nr:glycosyltransferase family 2 protein [Candidatus Gastranaerophilales bacterium]
MRKPTLAIIIPCFNEELLIESTVNSLFEVINSLIDKGKILQDSYVYVVDDGSTDKTWSIIEKLHKENGLAKGVRFVKNYGNQKALMAGLLGVREIGCDCVVSIDADLQQDQWAIETFVDRYAEGYDIVSGIRNGRETDSFFKKYTALFFYKLMNLMGTKIPVNHSDYRLVSKRALDILAQYTEKQLFLRGFFHEIGLKTAYVKFDVKPRKLGKSKFNFIKLLGLALNGITSFSIIPLRIIAVLGFFMALFSFGLGLEVLYEKVFLNSTPKGWATQVVMSAFFGGIQIFCLGIIGEYLGQVYREVKARPRYIKDIELY